MQKYSKINHEYKYVLVHFEEIDDLPALLKNIDLNKYEIGIGFGRLQHYEYKQMMREQYPNDTKKSWMQMDLSPLTDYPEISSLYLENGFTVRNLDALYTLNLHTLNFEPMEKNEIKTKEKLDLSRLKHLKYIDGGWGKFMVNLGGCKTLEKMKIWFYPDQDFSEIGQLNRLEELTLIQCKTLTLDGITDMPALKHIELKYSRTCKTSTRWPTART
ncbi:hypothetical protein HMPREF9120_01188 [Neisseria sp. oral taxon 020 str. F0370]|uniref:hypothetical protein n=1 Tax=Neisseria sp. oral taxon 020 TaxID=712401 RepID=UPI0002A1ABD3|nr:hypothetical protein [Neisseria sp. oral taxon 020]EKY06962.1 hypothetical protein HMPREF9120_01188 [Neisseria sp. oral taxon 020 str. F0370]